MPHGETIRLDIDSARELLIWACINSGANDEVARSISVASLDAEMEGSTVTGIAHLLLYCEAMQVGRVDATAEPLIETPTPVIFTVNANSGFPHIGFDRIFGRLCAAAEKFGIALFSSHNGFTCGNLGYFVRRLAEQGLVALGATNAGPPMLAASGSTKPVFATNPLAFAVPQKDRSPLLIDQSSSQTAWINIHNAAADGESIPEDWALDESGRPTTDPVRALKGAMLAAGGSRGANIALLVEMLAAGITGANWSLDAPSFADGEENPGVGLLVVAINPTLLGAADVEQRIGNYLDRLRANYGVYLPGGRRADNRTIANRDGIRIPVTLHESLCALAAIDSR